MHAPYSCHMEAVYRFLKYLKSAAGKGLLVFFFFFINKGLLVFSHGYLRLEAYRTADWAGSIDKRRSTSRYSTFLLWQ